MIRELIRRLKRFRLGFMECYSFPWNFQLRNDWYTRVTGLFPNALVH
jgi:hypothetical protein